MQAKRDLLGPIRAYAARHSWPTSRGVARIGAAALGAKAALLGGEALFAQKPEI